MILVEHSKDEFCDIGGRIHGTKILRTTADSNHDCRRKCQEKENCSDWKFYKPYSRCKMYSKKLSSSPGSYDYVSGSKFCILLEDNGAWGKYYCVRYTAVYINILFSVIQRPNKKFSLSKYLLPCKEVLLFVQYKGAGKDDVHNLTIAHTPNLNITLNDTHAIIGIENRDFECNDLNFELQIKDPDSNQYLHIVNFSKKAIDVEDYLGMDCRIR